MTYAQPRGPHTDSKSALLQAAEAAVAASPSTLPVREPRRNDRRRGLLPLLLIVGGACGVLLVARPSWLSTPPPLPEPPVIAEASARMTLVREAERIRSYRDSLGRLPSTLAEAGGPGESDVVYSSSPDGTFTLRLATDGRLVLHSTDNATEFLGASYESLLQRGSR